MAVFSLTTRDGTITTRLMASVSASLMLYIGYPLILVVSVVAVRAYHKWAGGEGASSRALAMLEAGKVEEWNTYRKEHPDWVPDLSEANLAEANLSKAKLTQANQGASSAPRSAGSP